MNDDSRLDCSDMDAATDDQLRRDIARLTRELEQAEAACAAYRQRLKSAQLYVGGYYGSTAEYHAIRDLLAAPDPGAALLDRLAAAETENNQLYHACEGLKEQLADAKAEQEKNDG